MLSLTRQEKQVLLFLISVALAGLGAVFLLKINSRAKVVICLYEHIGKIDLNTADQELLISVSGIGEKLAQRIIAYRDKQHGFLEVEELKKIKGITDYRYEKIRDAFIAR